MQGASGRAHFLAEDAPVDIGDTLVACQDGMTSPFGPYGQVRGEVPRGTEMAGQHVEVIFSEPP